MDSSSPNTSTFRSKPIISHTYTNVIFYVARLLKSNSQDKSKISYIGDLSDKRTVFIRLCETFLNSDILYSEVQMDGFSIFRANRNNRIGGGVCLYVNNLISCKILESYSNSTCELLIVKLNKPNLVVINLYRPPNCTIDKFKDIIEISKKCILSLKAPMPNIILTGDLNMIGIHKIVATKLTC